MDPAQYPGLRRPSREGVGTPQPPTSNPAFSESHPLLDHYPHDYVSNYVPEDLLWPLPTQTTIMYNHPSTPPAWGVWSQPSEVWPTDLILVLDPKRNTVGTWPAGLRRTEPDGNIPDSTPG